MSDGGKGSAPRPFSNRDQYYDNFDKIFGKAEPEEFHKDDSGIVFTCIPKTQSRAMLVQIYRGNQWFEGANLEPFGKILKIFHVADPEEGRIIANELRKEMR